MRTDAELIASSFVGDDEAFVEVIRRHQQAVWGYLVRRVGRGLAEDLLSEVWVAALRSRGGYDRSFPEARPWLFGIARNVLRRGGDPRLVVSTTDANELGPDWDPWPAIDARIDGATVLRRALRDLTDEQRDVLLLVVWEELTIAEAARSLGIPAGTARYRLHQARPRPSLVAGDGGVADRFQHRTGGIQMIVDEMDLIARFRQVESLPADVAERAELALRAAMALGVEDHLRQAEPVVAGRSQHEARRSPRRRRAVLVLVGVAAATVVTVAGLTVSSGHPPSPGPTVLPGVQNGTETVVYVVDRVSTALSAATGSISYSQARYFGALGAFLGASESWVGPKAAAFRAEDINASGAPTSGVLATFSPAGQPTVYIDFTHHVWTARHDPPGGISLGFGGLAANLPAGGDAASVASAALRAAESAGELRLAGYGTYNGQRVIELQEGGGTNSIWVDANSYLPVHEILTEPKDPQTGIETYDISFQWLPPTTANLQLLTNASAIPAGFTEVPPNRYPEALPNLAAPAHSQSTSSTTRTATPNTASDAG